MSCEWQDWPCRGKAANPRVFLDEIMISMKSDPRAALPIRAAALLHNQGLEMQLPPPELQGSLLPSAWASKFSFSLPFPHLQLGNLHSLPEFSLQTPRDLSVFMQTQPTSTKKIKLFSSAAPPRPAGGAGDSKPQNLSSPTNSLSISEPPSSAAYFYFHPQLRCCSAPSPSNFRFPKCLGSPEKLELLHPRGFFCLWPMGNCL